MTEDDIDPTGREKMVENDVACEDQSAAVLVSRVYQDSNSSPLEDDDYSVCDTADFTVLLTTEAQLWLKPSHARGANNTATVCRFFPDRMELISHLFFL